MASKKQCMTPTPNIAWYRLNAILSIWLILFFGGLFLGNALRNHLGNMASRSCSRWVILIVHWAAMPAAFQYSTRKVIASIKWGIRKRPRVHYFFFLANLFGWFHYSAVCCNVLSANAHSWVFAALSGSQTLVIARGPYRPAPPPSLHRCSEW